MGKRDTFKADRRSDALRQKSERLCEFMELDVVLQNSSPCGLKQQ